jgi:hypothetical protein
MRSTAPAAPAMKHFRTAAITRCSKTETANFGQRFSTARSRSSPRFCRSTSMRAGKSACGRTRGCWGSEWPGLKAPPVQAAVKGGRYRAEKVPVGQVLATFHIARRIGKMLKSSPADPHPTPERLDLVPAAARSGVKVEVKGDNSHQDFDLHNWHSRLVRQDLARIRLRTGESITAGSSPFAGPN